MKKFTLSLLFTLLAVVAVNQLFAQGNKEVVEVANLTELRAQELGDGTVFVVTGEVFITHMHGQRNQKYIQDDGAAIVIDDPSGIIETEYQLYDGLTGVSGTLSAYQSLIQFTPDMDPGAPSSTGNDPIEPMVLTIEDITPDHQAMLVRINDVEFDTELATFNSSTNYDLIDATGTIILRTPSSSANLDYFGTAIPDSPRDMVALVSQFSNDMQVFPRSLNDIYLDGVPAFDVTFVIIDENDDPITDAVITIDGETFEAGEYVFESLFAGNYAYTVEKENFLTREGSFAVSDEDLEIEVRLIAVADNMVETFPWVEDFEAGDFPPANWNHMALGVGGWAYTDNAYSGDQAVRHGFFAGDADSWLITPQIHIPEDEALLLKFFQNNLAMNFYGYSGVMISTGSGNPEHGEFVEVYESSGVINEYSERIINLGDYAGQVIYIAFVYQGDNAHEWFIDDVVVEPAPEAILVDNIAQLKEQDTGDLIYQIEGEVIVTHNQQAYRGQIYIQDDSGAILIDDNDGIIETNYDVYDGITGLKGTLTIFQNKMQLVPAEDPGAPSSTGNTVTPLELTLDQLTEEHEAKLVVVRNVSFDFDHEDFPDGPDFEPNESYYIVDATGTGVIRTPNWDGLLDYYGTPIPTTPKDIVGVLHQRHEVTRLQPRSLADFMEPASVNQITVGSFKVFPNPANAQFTVSGETEIDQLRIFNINGQLILDKPVHNHTITLNTEFLKTGLYIVQLISGDQILNHKLQIQK